MQGWAKTSKKCLRRTPQYRNCGVDTNVITLLTLEYDTYFFSWVKPDECKKVKSFKTIFSLFSTRTGLTSSERESTPWIKNPPSEGKRTTAGAAWAASRTKAEAASRTEDEAASRTKTKMLRGLKTKLRRWLKTMLRRWLEKKLLRGLKTKVRFED